MSAVFNHLLARADARSDEPDHADTAALRAAFAHDVLEGLARPRKSIPCTWLYDAKGSALFDEIARLDEYYPGRNEMWLLERCAYEIARAAGSRATVIELGSGSARKTPILLDALEAPAAYLPIDIAAQPLNEAARALRLRYPKIAITPIVADFTRITALPALAQVEQAARASDHGGSRRGGRRVVFFPGSTIGNFTPEAATSLLARIGHAVGSGALLVIGVDTTHDPAVLLPAYDDRHGVTAAFNKNLLTRINRELDADFSPSAFRHEARFDAQEQRVEMHLVSLYTQRVTLQGRAFQFAAGESIHTENAYKYGLVKFQAIAQRAGWSHRQLWMDGQSRVAVHVLERGR